jgi:hypothetical protein
LPGTDALTDALIDVAPLHRNMKVVEHGRLLEVARSERPISIDGVPA